jgi:hypothetical protein
MWEYSTRTERSFCKKKFVKFINNSCLKMQNSRYFTTGSAQPELRIRIRDPVLFNPNHPGSGSGMIFSGLGSQTWLKFNVEYWNSKILKLVPFRNIEKEGKLNFVWKFTLIMTLKCEKKVGLFYSPLLYGIRDPDPGWKNFKIQDKHPRSATMCTIYKTY